MGALSQSTRSNILARLNAALLTDDPNITVEHVKRIKSSLTETKPKLPSQAKEKIFFNQTSRTTWELTISHADSLNVDEIWADFATRRNLPIDKWVRTASPVARVGSKKTFLFTAVEVPKRVRPTTAPTDKKAATVNQLNKSVQSLTPAESAKLLALLLGE